MANSYDGLFSTISAAFNRASLAKEGRNALLGMVTMDLVPETAQKFDTINTNIVEGSGTTTNLTSGALTLADVMIDPGAVRLDQFPAYGFAIPNYQYSRMNASPVERLADVAVKKIGNAMNAHLAALITPGNFPTHVVNGAGVQTITDAKMAEAWEKLASADVPVSDLGNVFLVTHSKIYSNLLQSPSWTQSAFVGDPKAPEIRSSARLGLQWGAYADWDPDMPAAGGAHTSLLFHRNAIALVARAPSPPINDSVPYAYTQYKGIPILMTIDWAHRTQTNEIIFTALFGAKVIREDHGCRIQSTAA